MSKTVTLRLKDEVYRMFRNLAENENRPLSNFIETSVLRFIEQSQYADEFEMSEIQNNQILNKSLKQALKDAAAQRGRFVE